METKISFRKRIGVNGGTYNCRLNVFCTSAELFALNNKIFGTLRNAKEKNVKSSDDLNAISFLKPLFPGNNYTKITTAKFFCDYVGITKYLQNRNVIIKINLI